MRQLDAVSPRAARNETRRVLRQADETYAPFSCPSSAECCQLTKTQRFPYLWPSEWAVLLERLDKDRRPMPPPRADGACPFLDTEGKRCTVYEDRPFGCRTFFCEKIRGPSRQPLEATNALLERLTALNLAADSEAAPKSLPEWHSEHAR